MACAGTMTQSLSAYQRVYIPASGETSNGSALRLTTRGTLRGFATSLMVKKFDRLEKARLAASTSLFGLPSLPSQ